MYLMGSACGGLVVSVPNKLATKTTTGFDPWCSDFSRLAAQPTPSVLKAVAATVAP